MTTAMRTAPRPRAVNSETSPPRARLDLAPEPRTGALAGSWWPASRHPVAELSMLVTGLAARGVTVTHLSLSLTSWRGTPGRIRVGDRDVRVTWFAYRGSQTVTVSHGGGEITLRVIGPEG